MEIQSNNTYTATLLYELQHLLIQIKTCNGIADYGPNKSVEHLSQHGLSLLHYALYAIESQQSQLPFTSVSAGAAVYDLMQEIAPLASSYGVKVDFDASPHLEPVYADETSLKGSIYALLTGIITGSHIGTTTKITVAVQQTKPKEQRIGVYSDSTAISLGMLRQKAGNRTARMDSSGQSHRSGLGFLVSQLLASRLETKYSAFEHNQLSGVGFYLPESAQLQLL